MPEAPRIAGVVLAGGRSSRMDGQDKATVLLAGRTLLNRAVVRLAPQVNVLAVNSNGDPANLSTRGLPIIADTMQGYLGPLAGILAGLEWAISENADYLATVACDTPFFPETLVERLSQAGSNIALASSCGRLHPVFALWSTHMIDDLRSYLRTDARRSVLSYAERHDHARVDFELDRCGLDPFYNINTRQDLAVAERLAQKSGL